MIDCHTHLVFGGDRAHEFELRLAGASYEEIARAGGGILSTVRATRAASEDELVQAALPRLDAFLAESVTTIEIKSGYGLEIETERRQLRAARRLGSERAVAVTTTFLGAHAVPSDFDGDKDGYIDLVCREMLPAQALERLCFRQPGRPSVLPLETAGDHCGADDAAASNDAIPGSTICLT